MSRPKREYLIIALTTAVVFVVYMLTRAHAFVSFDAGELAAVQVTLGIAHPTGYPLFTILGHMWSQLPLGMTAVDQLNLLATIYCTAAVPFVMGFLKRCLPRSNRDMTTSLVAAGATLALMFGMTPWSVATSTEVHSLQFLIVAILLHQVVTVLHEPSTTKHWYWIALMLGLALSNHLTVVILVPGLAFVFFSSPGWRHHAARTLGLGSIIVFGVVTVLYTYILVRSGQEPLLNWGRPDTLSRLWDHVTARQYAGYTFTSGDVMLDNLRYYLAQLPEEFSILGVFLALHGLWVSHFRNRRLFAFLAITLVVNVLLAINYDIPDLSAYFMISYIVLGAFIAIGIHSIVQRVQSRALAFLIPFVLPIYLLMNHYVQADQSENYASEEYINLGLESVQQNAIILACDFQLDVSPWYYYRFVEGKRPDVILIDFVSLLGNDWYVYQFEDQFPEFVDEFRMEWEQHKEACVALRNQTEQNAARVRSTFRSLIGAIVRSQWASRPVYVSAATYGLYMGPGMDVVLPFDHTIVPQAYYMRVYPDVEYRPIESAISEPARYPPSTDSYTLELLALGNASVETWRENRVNIDEIRFMRARILDYRIQYEIRHGEWAKALSLNEFLAGHYPAYRLDYKVQEALRTFGQVAVDPG